MKRSNLKYRAGDIVTRCKPYVHALHDDFKGKLCDSCLCERTDLKRCAKCSMVYYCNRACQVKDWMAIHKYECGVEIGLDRNAEFFFQRHEYCLFVRFLMRMKHDANALQEHTLFDGSKRKITDLMAHDEEIRSDVLLEAVVKSIWLQLEKLNLVKDVDELRLRYGQFRVNKFGVVDVVLARLAASNCQASALYVEGAIFDHSCRPNTYIEYDGLKMTIRATMNITANQKIYVSYLPLLTKKAERLKILYLGYHFTCQCPRCSGDANDDARCEVANEYNRNIWHQIKQGDLKGAFDSAIKFVDIAQAILGEFNAQLVLLSMGPVLDLLQSKEIDQVVRKKWLFNFCKIMKDNARVCLGGSTPLFLQYQHLEAYYERKEP